ncbi:hypothetical protein GCM10011611_44900 [Aliidongia dinghuensis]|uniref:Uncharacterized protein n=1 Tax=Aliidongia dinghuensis TaxID=1867774 RepID=A0A8J2YXI7_9PROT|nr:hypothetical protein GCM10011611_44900 [Aliidongia dinghuensis]
MGNAFEGVPEKLLAIAATPQEEAAVLARLKGREAQLNHLRKAQPPRCALDGGFETGKCYV